MKIETKEPDVEEQAARIERLKRCILQQKLLRAAGQQRAKRDHAYHAAQLVNGG